MTRDESWSSSQEEQEEELYFCCSVRQEAGQGQARIRNAKQVITVNISIPGRRELSWSDHKNKLVAINPQLRLRSDILFRTDFSCRAELSCVSVQSARVPALTVTEIQIGERPDLVSDKVFVCSIVVESCHLSSVPPQHYISIQQSRAQPS